jgi:hypothetical protein
MGSPDSNRRGAERQEAVIVVALDHDGQFGVTRDVSESGLLIATRCKFSVGDEIELTIHQPSGPIEANGTVIRVEDTPPPAEWRYRIAVRIDITLPEDAIAAGAQAATKLLPKK